MKDSPQQAFLVAEEWLYIPDTRSSRIKGRWLRINKTLEMVTHYEKIEAKPICQNQFLQPKIADPDAILQAIEVVLKLENISASDKVKLILEISTPSRP